ncbi:F-box protein SKIP28 isoform X2 [Brachypodium distachyon]|uniref:F-box protein SKIP28 isoform X2 n=1 Tax=Brachypodium distachyon TaxID=15368 RepID=UPI000D0DE67D|nr:F-box protein SKIP28 isoform X2 [Brachypodium distachyon]|eukprot:XP_024316987.1 F-box protein SKIP28 isoform X2 [Brachypodium distachyon]
METAETWRLLKCNTIHLGLCMLYVPKCTGLTGDGVVKIVQLLDEQNGNTNRLRLHGISRMTKHHLDIINSLMCKRNPQVKEDGRPLFYNHRVHEMLNTNDERPIDVDVCPMCKNVRLVFDCTRDDCRKAEYSWCQGWWCRGCLFCVARCENCGGCISSEDLSDACLACSDFMCLACWLTFPKCSTCNRPYCERHGHLMVPLSLPGQFSCHHCMELNSSLERQEEGY